MSLKMCFSNRVLEEDDWTIRHGERGKEERLSNLL